MTFDIILFRKKIKIITYLDIFSFLSTSLANNWPQTKLSVFAEGAIENFLRANIWPDGFDSVFWQDSIEFLFVFCCSF